MSPTSIATHVLRIMGLGSACRPLLERILRACKRGRGRGKERWRGRGKERWRGGGRGGEGGRDGGGEEGESVLKGQFSMRGALVTETFCATTHMKRLTVCFLSSAILPLATCITVQYTPAHAAHFICEEHHDTRF